jgi:multidrug resistance efflux pump
LNRLLSDLDNALKVRKLKLEQNALNLKTISSDLKFWDSGVELYSKDFESIETLYKRGVVSVRERNYTKTNLEKARSEVEKLLSQRKILIRDRKIIEEEIAKEKEQYKNEKIIVEKKIKNLELEKETTLNSLQKELEMNEKMLSLKDGAYSGEEEEKEKMVRAEKTGTISELYFRNIGEYVNESTLLCTILPKDEPLFMEITVANKDIGFVKTNMEIKYKFTAYPYVDYGTLFGKVLKISPAATEDRDLGMVYTVQGSIDKAYFNIKGKKYPVKAGMTATAELVTGEKSIFSILFKKLKEKVKGEG